MSLEVCLSWMTSCKPTFPKVAVALMKSSPDRLSSLHAALPGDQFRHLPDFFPLALLSSMATPIAEATIGGHHLQQSFVKKRHRPAPRTELLKYFCGNSESPDTVVHSQPGLVAREDQPCSNC